MGYNISVGAKFNFFSLGRLSKLVGINVTVLFNLKVVRLKGLFEVQSTISLILYNHFCSFGVT